MADFATALPYVLRHEGGWADDPDDPGGATMRGITLETARQYGITTRMELRQISDEMISTIYRDGYWRFDGVTDQRVATKVFDMAVNMGVKSAVILVQRSLNVMGASLLVDGLWGVNTEDAINAVEPEKMLEMLCEVSAERYRNIVERRPTSQKFLNGWLRRAAEIPTE